MDTHHREDERVQKQATKMKQSLNEQEKKETTERKAVLVGGGRDSIWRQGLRALSAWLRILPLIPLRGWTEASSCGMLSSRIQRISEEATLDTFKYYD